MVSSAKSLDLNRLDLDRLVRADEAETLAVHRLERGTQLCKQRACRLPPPLRGRVGEGIARNLALIAPLLTDQRSVDLPLKGGGEVLYDKCNSQRAVCAEI